MKEQGSFLHINSNHSFRKHLVQNSSRLIVIDFYATWCVPCKLMHPQLHELANRYPSVVFFYVNVDIGSDIADQFDIMTIPTFLFIREQEVVDAYSGSSVDEIEARLVVLSRNDYKKHINAIKDDTTDLYQDNVADWILLDKKGDETGTTSKAESVHFGRDDTKAASSHAKDRGSAATKAPRQTVASRENERRSVSATTKKVRNTHTASPNGIAVKTPPSVKHATVKATKHKVKHSPHSGQTHSPVGVRVRSSKTSITAPRSSGTPGSTGSSTGNPEKMKKTGRHWYRINPIQLPTYKVLSILISVVPATICQTPLPIGTESMNITDTGTGPDDAVWITTQGLGNDISTQSGYSSSISTLGALSSVQVSSQATLTSESVTSIETTTEPETFSKSFSTSTTFISSSSYSSSSSSRKFEPVTEPPITTPEPRRTRPTTMASLRPATPATMPSTRPPPDTGQDIDNGVCDFGRFGETTMCEWTSSPMPVAGGGPHGKLSWRVGAGPTANWIGGPHLDASGDRSGGYIFVETSEGAGKDSVGVDGEPVATLLGPTSTGTGVHGSCLSFRYQMNGLSAAGLRILLLTPTGSREMWFSATPTPPGWHVANLLFTNHGPHQVALQAMATDGPGRSYRGHIAVDNLSLRAGAACPVSCTFAAGFCDWTNEQGDDFDWSLGSGSSNPATGPSVAADIWAAGGNVEAAHADQVAAASAAANIMGDAANAMEFRRHPGGYAYIDSSFPRRPGDAARLLSSVIPPTDPSSPWCLRFWFHMWGPGVAALRVIIRPSDGEVKPKVLWEMSGESSNTWFRAAVTLSALQPFQVVLEATVGAPDTGDIAVDDINLGVGPCPVAPQVAGRDSVDCSFELDECLWRPPPPAYSGGALDLWKRVSVKTLPEPMRRQPHGPTLRNDNFLKVKKPTGKADGSLLPVARLVTPTFPKKDSYGARCLSFWYLLTEMTPDDSNLGPGLLQVAVKRAAEDGEIQPALALWQIFGQQGPHWLQARVPIPDHNILSIELHGQWSSNRTTGIIAIDDVVLYHGECTPLPVEAAAEPQDCSFESGPCAWHNYTDMVYPSDAADPHWQLASVHHRPADLTDMTFHAPGGYAFFDIFSLSGRTHRTQLRSPPVQGKNDRPSVCVSFWYAAFGAGDTTRLRLVRRSGTDDKLTVWELAAKGLDTSKPRWEAAQASMDSTTNFTILLEGEASNGGFAVDDLRLRPGACETRPPRATVATYRTSTS